MLHQGQDPNASDYDGRTALMLACMKGHKHLVQVRILGGFVFWCSYLTRLSAYEHGFSTASL